MSTHENLPDDKSADDVSLQATTDLSSERARAIARRNFLRRSAGVAAPVVMTLQSGPVLAVQSITCQDKTNTPSPGDAGFADIIPSGFNEDTVGSPPFDYRIMSATDAAARDISTHPSTLLNGQRISSNLGSHSYIRCIPTELGTPGIDSDDFALTSGTQNSGTWRFMGSQFSGGYGLGGDPKNNIGPVGLFTIDANGEDIFQGCFGDNRAIPNDAVVLTTSCWTSLHPGGTINPNP